MTQDEARKILGPKFKDLSDAALQHLLTFFKLVQRKQIAERRIKKRKERAEKVRSA